MSNPLLPLMGMLCPLAKKYITPETMVKVHDSLMGRFEAEAGNRLVATISKKGDGTVVVSVVGIDNEHRIRHQYYQEPLDEVVSQLVGKL